LTFSLERFDFVIVGAGIAGASIAAQLAPYASVLLLESEAHPGYHATGRSAAFWSETYGGPDVQPLTSASYDFLANPPAGFSECSLLSARGELNIGRAEDAALLKQFEERFAKSGILMERLDRSALVERLPALKSDWVNAVSVPSCAEIDVAALHAGWLAQAKRAGAMLRCNASVKEATRGAAGWEVVTSDSRFGCYILVNAAGAWADHVAAMAGVREIGIQPFRRTISQLRLGADVPRDLPLIIDINETFYFKSDGAGGLWLSPHDETPSDPVDAAPDELDIAMAIARLEQVVDWPIRAVTHKWAGLRSFAPDRLPVYGFDVAQPDFFWFAGQGGFGIQTAPAAAKIAASAILGKVADNSVTHIDPGRYSPARFKY
jgi:D-arginine dehydrogenase